jgi:hypothetical protein
MEKKVILNKDNRIKRSENFESLKKIENEISYRIRSEYSSEKEVLNNEINCLLDEEKQFRKDALELLRTCNEESNLRVSVQVGPNNNILYYYRGHLQRKLGYNDTSFNFISDDRDNDGRPFTIGFSCLQSVEIL